MNRALLIALFPILCLGWVAQASAAEWAIEEKTLTQRGLKEESVTSSQGPITMEATLAGSKVKIACGQVKSTGKILATSKGELTVEFSKCSTTINGVAAPECVPKEPVVSKLSSELRDDAAKLVVYDFLKPQTGTTFITYTFGLKCALPEKWVFSGETAAEVPQGIAVSKSLKFSEPIAKAAGTKLTTPAGLLAYFNGPLIAELSGKNIGKKWGACVACNYIPGEGSGPGNNPSIPNFCKACQGDPVDPFSGDFTESQTDLSVAGRGPALEVVRSYDSQLAATQKTAGPFGFGWAGPYGAYLEVSGETTTVHQENGSTVAFKLSAGKYEANAWTESTLVKEGTNYIFTLPTQEKLEFNSSGQLIKITDRHGNALALAYKEGKLETVEDAAHRTLIFTYKEAQVESIKDPMGNVVKYTYESSNLATVTLPGEEKARWKFKYDASHRLTEMTDGRGNTMKNEYDGSNRVTLQTDRVGNKLKLEYKEKEGIKETITTEPNGSTTVETFNMAGEPTQITKASGTELAQTTKYEYNFALALVKVTDPLSHVTTYGYDAEGNKTSKRDANENETKWEYNAKHDMVKETSPGGETTTITRNAAGDPETIKRPAPGGKTQETKFKYAANGDLEEEIDPLERVTKFEYDVNGNLKAHIDPEGGKRTWAYNEDGQLTSEVSPRGNKTGAKASEFEIKFERDPQGRVKTVTDPLGHETKLKYNANGNLEVITNQNGHATTYVYDANDKRTETIAPNGDAAKAAYDAEGNVKSRTDGNGHTTKYEHNLLEQVTEVIDPLERKVTKTYDAAGNLKEVKDPEGRTTTYAYDPGNRLKEINYSDAGTPDVTYEYNSEGNVKVMKDGTGTVKYTYDVLNRVTEVENGNKEIVKYEYDLADQKTKITYPNGKSITRAFDKDGRLEKVTDWLGKETTFSYNLDSQPEATTFPAASEDKDEYEYNQVGQLIKTTMKKGATTLASISYTRDNAGQLKSATQKELPGAEKLEYKYDENERLKEGAGTSFAYDAANDPTTLGSVTLKYDAASQLEEGGGTKYTFDKLGERTKATPEKGPATTYGYDQYGDLISVTRAKEGEEFKEIKDTYTYDGKGLRASQTINGSTTHMVWNTTEALPLLLTDGANSYIFGPEGLPFEQINSKEEASYLHHDQQSSTRLITNSSGETTGTYTYTPYGEVLKHTGAATTPLGYNGQYTSEDTGLIYLRARVYDPVTAQFMSVDPLVAQTAEPYGYADHNPMDFGDPSGKQLRTPRHPGAPHLPAPAPPGQNDPFGPLPPPPCPLAFATAGAWGTLAQGYNAEYNYWTLAANQLRGVMNYWNAWGYYWAAMGYVGAAQLAFASAATASVYAAVAQIKAGEALANGQTALQNAGSAEGGVLPQ